MTLQEFREHGKKVHDGFLPDKKKFVGSMAWCCRHALLTDFDASAEDRKKLSNAWILIAYYDGYYDGDAFVLFVLADKLFLAVGSHCSCYGLEGQWKPEEVLLDQILAMESCGARAFRKLYKLPKKELPA